MVMDLEANGDDLQKELLNLEHTIRCRLLF